MLDAVQSCSSPCSAPAGSAVLRTLRAEPVIISFRVMPPGTPFAEMWIFCEQKSGPPASMLQKGSGSESRNLASSFQSSEPRHLDLHLSVISHPGPPHDEPALLVDACLTPSPSSGASRPAYGTGQRLRGGTRHAPMAVAVSMSQGHASCIAIR